MLYDIFWASSFVFLGWSANYMWRAFKIKTRFLIPYKEFIREEPDDYHKMIHRLRMENGLLRGKVEQLQSRLDSMRDRRKAQ